MKNKFIGSHATKDRTYRRQNTSLKYTTEGEMLKEPKIMRRDLFISDSNPKHLSEE